MGRIPKDFDTPGNHLPSSLRKIQLLASQRNHVTTQSEYVNASLACISISMRMISRYLSMYLGLRLNYHTRAEIHFTGPSIPLWLLLVEFISAGPKLPPLTKCWVAFASKGTLVSCSKPAPKGVRFRYTADADYPTIRADETFGRPAMKVSEIAPAD